MNDQNPPKPFTFGEMVKYSNELLAQHQHLANHHVEMREHLLAAPPTMMTHDDHDRVVIFLGVYHRGF